MIGLQHLEFETRQFLRFFHEFETSPRIDSFHNFSMRPPRGEVNQGIGVKPLSILRNNMDRVYLHQIPWVLGLRTGQGEVPPLPGASLPQKPISFECSFHGRQADHDVFVCEFLMDYLRAAAVFLALGNDCFNNCQ